MGKQVAHPSSGQDPPKKTSWTKRFICFFAEAVAQVRDTGVPRSLERE